MSTIYIGLGGTGVKTVTKIKGIYDRFAFTRVNDEQSQAIFAGIDIDSPPIDAKHSIEFFPVSVGNPREGN